MSGVRHILPSSIQHAGDSLPGAADGQHIIATKNRWSRVVLTFENVSPDVWCELSFDLSCHPDEVARAVHDFAAVGVSFLMEDGSAIDFAYIPGLARAQIDPFNAYVAGPQHFSQRSGMAPTYKARCTFLIPAPTQHLMIAIRGWRNSHPFQVINPTLRQFIQPGGVHPDMDDAPLVPSRAEAAATSRITRTWKVLTTEPHWFRYALVTGNSLFVRGQIVAKDGGKDGALARVIFRNARGEELPPPYQDLLMTPVIGAFANIPAHIQARRFTLELVPPPGAATVELGFQAWRNGAAVELVMPLEISLEVGLLLENVAGDDAPDAATFLERLFTKIGMALPSDWPQELFEPHALAERLSVHTRLKAVRIGKTSAISGGQLHLGGFAPWPLPETPNWTEDPYRSPLWRQEFHSLAWLLDIANNPDAGGLERALALALSWSRANPWGQPTDDLNVHPICLAVRTEVFLEILALVASAGSRTSVAALLELMGEIVRHCFALAEILGQNVLSHSIYQLHTAASLLAAARALPRIPLASHWASLALACLEQGFDELVTSDGILLDQSPHQQLEIISLGMILSDGLKGTPDARALHEDLSARLKSLLVAIIRCTDPAGMLPAFGDTPHGYHYASWIRRLLSQYGRDWRSDAAINAELSYPQGSRVISLPNERIVAARHYERGKGWGYFGVSLSEQRNGQGHYDTTSFQFATSGIPWIVDPGGAAQHELGPARQYLVSPRAHNVAIPDGREPAGGTSWLQSTTSIDGIDVFSVRSNAYGPDYVHLRIFLTTNDLSAMAVLDAFEGETLYSFEGLLHFDRNVATALSHPQSAIAFKDRKRLHIVPRLIAGRLSGMEVVQGLSDRHLPVQGFVSHPTQGLEAANVLRYRISGQGRLCGGVVLAVSQAGLTRIVRALDDERLKEHFRAEQHRSS